MKKLNRILYIALAACLLASVTGCNSKNQNKTKAPSIAVFVPGILDNSPTYQDLVEGVNKAVEAYNATASEKAEVFIMEAGTNQAEWSPKITTLCATKKYDVIISSNPSLPALIDPISVQFPKQKFIVLDADGTGNKNVAAVAYGKAEQSFLTGYMAGLMSKNHHVALVAAQEYPVMNNVILPNFEKGAKAAYSDTSCDFRVVGNWYDAAKGLEITNELVSKGADVFLPICGGASQGVINAAKETGTYITWFDSDGFAYAPGTIIASSVAKQVKLAEKVTSEWLSGKTAWGTSETLGLKEGYIEFIEDAPEYIDAVPADIRAKMHEKIESLR